MTGEKNGGRRMIKPCKDCKKLCRGVRCIACANKNAGFKRALKNLDVNKQ